MIFSLINDDYTIEYVKAICLDEFDNIVSSRSRARASNIMSTEEQIATIVQKLQVVHKEHSFQQLFHNKH